MRKSISCCLLLVSFFGFQPIYGQYTDSLWLVKNLKIDTAPSASIDWSSAPVRNSFSYKAAIAPTAMIVYGITSLKSHGLQDWNRKVKEELWMENPHERMHIDNFLHFAPAVAVYGLNMVGIKGKNNFKDRSIIYAMSNVIMTSMVFSVKKISREERPDGSDNYSFPSGHTASAFVAAEFLRQEYKDVSPWYGVAGYAVAASTGYLRMYNNKHWFGDVVAGAGVGILSTKLAYYIYPSVKRIFSKKDNLSTIIMPTYQNKAIGLGMVHSF